ncbi:beta-ketoacyl-ACP synthase III [Mucilaginibacter daejeonensis]|uniref:beta-ketoacyl-ACP synthase III n=1 Tax=Mucilaginibacter daejeonensis TaxID=398049 RepID=UPI001D17CFA9|nr:beta-ketoacyl-ACP synthase III [Mucilaginibacter daejeonensis]UEG52755.1 beta-ketoacyl-ACP synthase III [Mucilaginibacter daejeonensis]
MSNNVYINHTSAYFPNDPVSNDEMEEYLGYINNKPSKSKKIVLRNNGITNRYYALNKERKSTHTNAQMTAEAIKALFSDQPDKIREVQLLACGTSSPDQVMPSHGVMTHGQVPEIGSIEVVSPAGVCCAGMHALKYAYLAIKAGDTKKAVATGSERFSGLLVSDVFEEESQKLIEMEANPYIAFSKEFLRWMLSDGASAFLLSDTPNPEGQSLRIDWIEGVSYANDMNTCMYMGGEKQADGSLKGFMDFTPEEIMNQSIFSVKQDISLLSDNIVPRGGQKIKEIFERKGLTADDIDWFLPHISSNFFRSKIYDMIQEYGGGIPYDKWFINLYTVGNVGAASIYLMINELFNSGKLKKGERILLLVPESARFSYMYAMLTVV